MYTNSNRRIAPAIMYHNPGRTLESLIDCHIPQPITMNPNHKNLSNTKRIISNSWASVICFFEFFFLLAIFSTSNYCN